MGQFRLTSFSRAVFVVEGRKGGRAGKGGDLDISLSLGVWVPSERRVWTLPLHT